MNSYLIILIAIRYSPFRLRYDNKEQAVDIIKGIIDKNLEEIGKNLRVHMFCYTIGKEEICVGLAKAFKTKIYVDPMRYKYIKNTNYHLDCFTKKQEEAFIYLTKGIHADNKVAEENTINIKLSGWCNTKTYISLNKGEYLVAYSSHSNYQELDRFVSLIRPGILNTIVIERQQDTFSVNSLKKFESYSFWLKSFKHRGLSLLSKLTRRTIL